MARQPSPETMDLMRSHLEYDPNSGLLTWVRSRTNRIQPGDEVTGLDKGGYLRVYINGHSYKAHRVIWFLMTGCWPIEDIDHEDGNPSENKWFNLRLAEHQQNMQNRKPDGNRPFKGVYPSGRGGSRFFARVCRGNEQRYLGTFGSPEAAAKAYDEAALELFGAFARLNFPPEEINV